MHGAGESNSKFASRIRSQFYIKQRKGQIEQAEVTDIDVDDDSCPFSEAKADLLDLK